MDVIMDTNIASTFGKIDRLDLLQKLFPASALFISRRVEEELGRSERWQELLKKIKKNARVTAPSKAEESLEQNISSKRAIGKAEAECIAIARSRKMMLLTNDKIAVKEARAAGADVMDLRAVIRELWKEKVLPKEAAEALIAEIEEKDSVIFADKEKVFE